jgi:DNA mismatch repair protein MutS2
MDPKDLATLELPAVLKRLSGFTDFSASRELALELAPTVYGEIARRLQAETSEARRLLGGDGKLTIGGARDVRTQAEGAARSKVLEPQELLDVQSTLISARTLARRFKKEAESYPVLAGIAADLAVDTGLIAGIAKVLDDRGQVKDSASKKLARLRRELRASRERLSAKLDRMVSDPKLAPMLQEAIVTQREGRFVIPLRAEFKGRIEAVVHDQSSSGATLFVEPLTIVESNNEVRELELAEDQEIRRILAELSAAVGEHAEEIRQSVVALAGLDLAFAKARYAEQINASEPELRESATSLELRAARHPLLDESTVVPIDLVLSAEVKALVITGPNTGGKTVTLKTAGLLVAMAQCGMHLPVAPGSALRVFQSIYADIGDEQSIEQSLSTFSSHISNIIRILGFADRDSLVLLDELGAGTDPGEGAALARSLLAEFSDRAALTLVATHFPDLKLYAHQTPGVRNASVEFDLESLRPTYRLQMGLPGRSNALAIAERLGLDHGIVERARAQVSPEDLQADSLLEDIRSQQQAAESARVEAETAASEARALRDQLRDRLAAIDEERRQVLDAAREQARQETDSVAEELRHIRAGLAAAEEYREQLSQLERELMQVEARLEVEEQKEDEYWEPLQDLTVGDRVMIRSIASEGIVTALGPNRAEVQVGNLRIKAEMNDLGPPGEIPAQQPPARQVEVKVASAPPSQELNLRGRTVEEALEQLERWMDAAYMAGMPYLRVVHGKGTGALRRAIREWLGKSPYSASVEPGAPSEGGDGVTVVKLEFD